MDCENLKEKEIISTGSICDKDYLWESLNEEEQELREELEKFPQEQNLKEEIDIE